MKINKDKIKNASITILSIAIVSLTFLLIKEHKELKELKESLENPWILTESFDYSGENPIKTTTF